MERFLSKVHTGKLYLDGIICHLLNIFTFSALIKNQGEFSHFLINHLNEEDRRRNEEESSSVKDTLEFSMGKERFRSVIEGQRSKLQAVSNFMDKMSLDGVGGGDLDSLNISTFEPDTARMDSVQVTHNICSFQSTTYQL